MQSMKNTKNKNFQKIIYFFRLTLFQHETNFFIYVLPFQILLKIGIAIYTALDFNLSQDEECIISSDLEQLINLMTYEGNLCYSFDTFIVLHSHEVSFSFPFILRAN